jgi:hypothetical protein
LTTHTHTHTHTHSNLIEGVKGDEETGEQSEIREREATDLRPLGRLALRAETATRQRGQPLFTRPVVVRLGPERQRCETVESES